MIISPPDPPRKGQRFPKKERVQRARPPRFSRRKERGIRVGGMAMKGHGTGEGRVLLGWDFQSWENFEK